MEVAVFFAFAVLAVTFAVIVVAHPDPVKSTMSMVVTLFCLAVLFVLLGAPFIAALQVLLYTGAILVLFLFVIMLLNVQRVPGERGSGTVQSWTAFVAAAFLAGFLGMLAWRTYGEAILAPLTEESTAIKPLAWELFTTYLLPFEIVGLLLLVAVVAASFLARNPSSDTSGPGGEA